ncbi:hypothetical protein [Pseudomonas sp. S1(2024)]|uniref:hypothetical protein n=1 Tax=Pseudomonas sp. S1(2024) TaxID=3390191 RepID=UPI00397B3502
MPALLSLLQEIDKMAITRYISNSFSGITFMKDILFLSDLDNCLFQSLRVNSAGVHPMTFKASGEAHCFATEAQNTLFNLLKPRAFCVAVTARTPDQMQRTRGWAPEHVNQLALTDHGATLLYRNIDDSPLWTPLPAWSDTYRDAARVCEAPLEHDLDTLSAFLPELFLPAHAKAKIDLSYSFGGDVPFYITLQIKNLKAEEIAKVMQIVQLQLEPVLQTLQGTYIQHQNDYTLAFWPTYVSKEKAAQRLISALKTGIGDARFDQAAHEIGEIALILTAGDSHTDVPFMRLGDFMLTPAVSPIAEQAGQHAQRHMNI